MKLPVLSPWYADGLRFTCTASGDCCTGGHGFVWVTREEIRRMAGHLKLPVREFVRTYCRRVGGKVSLNERRNRRGKYDCVFLVDMPGGGGGGGGAAKGGCGNRRGCSVYPVRPTQCRTWPFWPENLTDRAAWDAAAEGCAGMNRGRFYPAERVEALRDAEDWPEDPPTSRQGRR